MHRPRRESARHYHGACAAQCRPLSWTMSSASERILVTGGLGWLGSRLVEVLVQGIAGNVTSGKAREGLHIRCLVLPGQDVSPLMRLSSQIEIVIGNLENPADCGKFCEGA